MPAYQSGLADSQLHTLFMQAPVLIGVMRGPDFVVEFANPAILKVWGRTESEVIGKPLLEALPELEPQPYPRLLQRVYRTGEPYYGREAPADISRSDGSTQTVHFNFVYSPYRDAAGTVEGIVVIASDVSEQVTEREERERFLRKLSHELRNPLSPLVTAIALLKGMATQQTQPIIDVMERQVKDLTRLVERLSEVSASRPTPEL